MNRFTCYSKGDEKGRAPTARILRGLLSREIQILPLFRCDRELLLAVEKEAKLLTNPGRSRASGWGIPRESFNQYNLYSRGDDPGDFIEELDIWRPGRRFIPRLVAIPKLLKTYFGKSVLQNCRLLTVNHFGLLAAHQEPMIRIPGKEDAFKIRFHLPLSTSPRVKFFMEDRYYTMRKGMFYLYNQSCWHGVENVLGVKRAHLVFDYYLNRHIMESMIEPALERMVAE